MVSVVILTYNEEEVLGKCLKSLDNFANEIILIDSNSTDNTIKIAKKFNAKIIINELTSFSEQRNLGMRKASGDWIYYLDADEELTNEFKKEASNLINSFNPESDIAGYYVIRKTFYFGKDWDYSDKVQRLFYKRKLIEWFGTVHETPKVNGRFDVIESPILHYTHRNIEQMIEKTNKWSYYEAELRYKARHPKITWWRLPRVMLTGFFSSYIKQNGYKNGTYGLIEAIYQSYSIFITYSKLWEMQNRKNE